MPRKAKQARMTKAHFDFIANIIRNLNFSHYHTKDFPLEYVATRFTDELKATNPKFNPEKFFDACLLTSEEIEDKKKASKAKPRKRTRHADDNRQSGQPENCRNRSNKL